jgi:peptidoglycan/xylan/chitin deacetylase (PgdA/CDA1 family)
MSRFVIILITLLSLSCNSQPANNQVFDIPAFVYHRFGDARYPSTNISTEIFEQQLQYLKENDFELLAFGDAMERWQKGVGLPEKAAILTIDDGYLSFYENGFPLLKKFGMPATMFVQTATVGGNDYMTWEQLCEIQKYGIEVLNHSHSHEYFVNIPEGQRAETFQDDLRQSTALFEKHMNFRPRYYSYPYGEFTPEMAAVLKKNGYHAAAAQKSGVFSDNSNRYEIPRFPMGGMFATLNGFISKANMKAIRIIKPEFGTSIIDRNPPSIELEILFGVINLTQLQFFVDGRKSEGFTIDDSATNPLITLQSSDKVSGRHTIYTITAPTIDGRGWRWHTHLWINPAVGN